MIVTSFASNIDRIDHALRAADATGRRVTFIGRSVRRNMSIAERLGEITPPRGDTVGPRELETLQPRRSLVICTGSQAERNAVLSRAAAASIPSSSSDAPTRWCSRAGRCPATSPRWRR